MEDRYVLGIRRPNVKEGVVNPGLDMGPTTGTGVSSESDSPLRRIGTIFSVMLVMFLLACYRSQYQIYHDEDDQ